MKNFTFHQTKIVLGVTGLMTSAVLFGACTPAVKNTEKITTPTEQQQSPQSSTAPATSPTSLKPGETNTQADVDATIKSVDTDLSSIKESDLSGMDLE